MFFRFFTSVHASYVAIFFQQGKTVSHFKKDLVIVPMNVQDVKNEENFGPSLCIYYMTPTVSKIPGNVKENCQSLYCAFLASRRHTESRRVTKK